MNNPIYILGIVVLAIVAIGITIWLLRNNTQQVEPEIQDFITKLENAKKISKGDCKRAYCLACGVQHPKQFFTFTDKSDDNSFYVCYSRKAKKSSIVMGEKIIAPSDFISTYKHFV